MSQPQFPNVPDLTRQTAINEIISSIASEELALSHIINAEGEKIQYAVGTLSGLSGTASVEDVLDINDSVRKTLNSALENQIMLNDKLAGALDVPVFPGATGPTGPIGPTGPDMGATGATGPAGA